MAGDLAHFRRRQPNGAALSLLSIAAWVKLGLKKKHTFVYAPFWFMLVTTVFSLIIEVKERFAVAQPNYLLSCLAVILIVLGIAMSIAGIRTMHSGEKQSA